MTVIFALMNGNGLASTAPDINSANLAKGRLGREWNTMASMIRLHCRVHHDSAAALCPECRQLLNYARARLERCRFGPEKPTCARCPVHCYQRVPRDQIKAVMRYAGPRMLWRHPLLSLFHWLDGFRGVPRDPSET